MYYSIDNWMDEVKYLSNALIGLLLGRSPSDWLTSIQPIFSRESDYKGSILHSSIYHTTYFTLLSLGSNGPDFSSSIHFYKEVCIMPLVH